MTEEVKLRENLVYGIENPLIDMNAIVDDALFEKYGLRHNLQNYIGDCATTLFDELLEKYDAKCHGGGGTYNTMKIFQWMLQEPRKVGTFIACIGKDNLGEILKNDAPNEYLDIYYYEMDKELTGTCAVLVNNGHCTFVSRHGGIGTFDEDFFESSQNLKLLEKAQYYYMAGFFLVAGETSFVKLAKYAYDNNKLFLFNLSAVYLTLSYKDRLDKIVPYSDYIFCNNDEARAYAKVSGYPSDNLEDVANWLRELPKVNKTRERVVIITCGPRDTIVATVNGISFYPVIPVDEKEVVDTCGAGDSFVGGFLSQLIQGKSIDDCIRAGHYASNFIIKRYGCNYSEIKPNFK